MRMSVLKSSHRFISIMKPLFFRERLKLLRCARFGVVALAGVAATWSWAQTREVKPSQKMVPIIANYRDWTLVNQTPAPMDPTVAMMCADIPLSTAPNLSKTAVMGSGGPHQKKWINVFVNDAGKAAMLTAKKPQFPVGTVIVKEKLAAPQLKSKSKGSTPAKPKPSQEPELLTVMIKREAGYNKTGGDWEYMVADGPGRTIAERGKLARCQSCHRPYKSTDYVVRSYLPTSIMEALRDSDMASVVKK